MLLFLREHKITANLAGVCTRIVPFDSWAPRSAGSHRCEDVKYDKKKTTKLSIKSKHTAGSFVGHTVQFT